MLPSGRRRSSKVLSAAPNPCPTTRPSDFMWERLRAWGVTGVFGYPGDGIGGIIGALARTHGALEFVHVRHEELAAFTKNARCAGSNRPRRAQSRPALPVRSQPHRRCRRHPARTAADARTASARRLAETIARDKDHFRAVERKRSEEPRTPIDPQLVFAELSPRLPEDAILTADAGTTADWFSLSGGLASMGSATPLDQLLPR